MNIKACTEEYLKTSGLDYTVLRLCGFMQVCWGAASRCCLCIICMSQPKPKVQIIRQANALSAFICELPCAWLVQQYSQTEGHNKGQEADSCIFWRG